MVIAFDRMSGANPCVGSAVQNNYGAAGKLWTDGNFDYSGTVNLSDYTAIIQNYGTVA